MCVHISDDFLRFTDKYETIFDGNKYKMTLHHWHLPMVPYHPIKLEQGRQFHRQQRYVISDIFSLIFRLRL